MSNFERRGFSDELNIETPEQVELNYAIAGIGSRFVAVLVDQLIQGAAIIVIILVLALVVAASSTGVAAHASRITGSHNMDTAGKWALALIIFVIFCINWGYYSLFEAYWHGQTPGKRVMKLRVIKDSGRQITLFEALARNLLRWVDYLPGFYLTGIITMLCNKRNKRLGDFAAGTIVVHEQRAEQPLLYTGTGIITQTQFAYEQNPAHTAGPSPFAADAIAKLGPADLVVLEAFFARALDLSVEVRAAMALRIAQQMTAKMGMALPEGNPERALEAMAAAMRGMGRAPLQPNAIGTERI